MASDAQAVLHEALQLDERERADLITALVASLDGEADADEEEIARVWAEEASRRADRYFAGESTAVDFDVALEQLRSGLKPR